MATVNLDTAEVRPRQARPPIAAPPREDYDPGPEREKVRGQIALWLILLLVGLTAAPFVLIIFRAMCVGLAGVNACAGLPAINVGELLTLFFAPIVALVGAATGFYFGEKGSVQRPE